MEERLAQQRVEHKQKMNLMSALITERFAAQMAAYKAHFCLLEGSTIVSSEPEVTTACHIDRSSVDSTQGNNQVIFFYYHLIRRSFSVNKYLDNE